MLASSIAAARETIGILSTRRCKACDNLCHSRRRCERTSRVGREARNCGIQATKDSARYVQIVEWSDEDGCYVGSSPGLFLGGCHGDDERKVFEELCEIVKETIKVDREDGKPLPPATSGRDIANRLQHVARPTRRKGPSLRY
ncbi:MAG TPA: type II toxin-antitoxin system HicB family antitoxin [Pirellulales bacterium]|nr:type II toxin-antitoxin system HicB family antitoxin [Pirellulales bacterium]